ncbi:MAG: carbon-nitrogen family hydrolase [Ardenticatenaceae bacterium]|nr:carbon-nitrogen family hydrolase [Ardenticatenaceae bacterium]MCB9442990.1 carbon-nitrogen family hydrolase [Ardenticatenaceae bacterium]
MAQLVISLGQMDVVLGKPEVNLAQVQRLAAEASRQGADVLVLPELWSTGYDLDRASDYATAVTDGIFAEMANLAKAYGIHLVGSCLSLLGEGEYGNTAVLLDPDGELMGAYSKVHLFQLMDEHKYLTPGNCRSLVSAPWGKSGLAICYDLRFPELFRAYALDGANIVFLPAEWPYPRLAHWQTLLRARAIENQMVVVACNRVGTTDGTSFFGHSCIIDPWGEIVVEAGDTPALLTVAVDLAKVAEIRAQIPVFADRNPAVYVSE